MAIRNRRSRGKVTSSNHPQRRKKKKERCAHLRKEPSRTATPLFSLSPTLISRRTSFAVLALCEPFLFSLAPFLTPQTVSPTARVAWTSLHAWCFRHPLLFGLFFLVFCPNQRICGPRRVHDLTRPSSDGAWPARPRAPSRAPTQFARAPRRPRASSCGAASQQARCSSRRTRQPRATP